jgi:hypothetical protein
MVTAVGAVLMDIHNSHDLVFTMTQRMTGVLLATSDRIKVSKDDTQGCTHLLIINNQTQLSSDNTHKIGATDIVVVACRIF